jgi:CysZ protein
MSEVARASTVARPGPLRRALAGAFYVPEGIGFLIRKPRLWPLAALPLALAAALLVGGLLAGLFAVPFADELVASQRDQRGLLGLLFAVALWAGLPVAGLLLGLGLALLLAAPVLERLSIAVERLVRGEARESGLGPGWEILQSLRVALYFAVRTPGMFLVSLLPLVGPPLGALWAAHALAFQMTEPTLQRQGMDFWARRLWHQHHRAESLGFGLAAFLALFVPLANLLLAPSLTVGATRLVLELQDEPPEPPPA